MKLLSFLLVSTAALISVEATIPDYIHVCKRNDPKLNKCVENSVLALLDKLQVGISELDIPSLDPLYLDNLDLNLGPGLKAKATGLKLFGGMKDMKIHDLDVNLDTDVIKAAVTMPVINVRGFYDVDGKLGTLPLKGNGPMSILAKTVTGRATVYGKKVQKGGKTLYYFPTMEMKLEIEDYQLKLDNLFGGDPIIGEATNKILNEEKGELLKSVLPGIEKTVITELLAVANKITKHFEWNELFPES